MTSAPAARIDARQLTRVVAIMTHLRSGSGLMSSLLDGHPNVLMTPDCLLMGYQQFWENYGHLPADELVTSFVDYYAVLFDAREKSMSSRTGTEVGENLHFTQLGPNRDECLQVDREAFKRSITEIIATDKPVDRKLFFQAMHVAYAEAMGRSVTEPVIVFGLHIDNVSSVESLLEDFPDTLFLQMVRHPILSVGSHFRHLYRYGNFSPRLAISTMFRALYAGRPAPRTNGSNWCAVRLEDLHQKPRETLRRICDWLHLDWDESLLDSTVNGKQWWNEKDALQISGSSEAIIAQRFEEFIPGFDRFRLNVLFAPKSQAWGYSVSRWHQSAIARLLVLPLLLVPFKMEFLSERPFNKSYASGKSLFQRMVLAIDALAAGRWFLLKAWVNMLKGYHHELTPL